MKNLLRSPPLCVALMLLAASASASEPASGTFEPNRNCDAYVSFKKGTNPGLVKVKAGVAYEIAEVNDRDRHWFRIEMPGVTEPLRWVAAECGTATNLVVSPAGPGGKKHAQCSIPDLHDYFVLAVTWQPGFCEHFKYKGVKPECDHMADGSLVITNLTLHGLWPNKTQCGTTYGSCSEKPLELSEDTVSYVAPWMPNFHFESTFGQYEWKKHGTCQTGMDADTYFRRSVDAVRTINDSVVGQYIRSNVGGEISKKKFYELVAVATGDGTFRSSFSLICSGKYLVEIRVRLPLDFREGGSLKQLIGQTAPSDPVKADKECAGDAILIEASG